MLFKIMENVAPELGTDIIAKEALNQRLGISDPSKMLSLEQIQMQVAQGKTKFKNITEMFAVPEIDKWQYSDGYAYVCSSYVVSFYQMSGMLGDLEIVPSEFTPGDIYQMDLLDITTPRPAECVAADPDLKYC